MKKENSSSERDLYLKSFQNNLQLHKSTKTISSKSQELRCLNNFTVMLKEDWRKIKQNSLKFKTKCKKFAIDLSLKIHKRKFGILEFTLFTKFVRRWMRLNSNLKKVRFMTGDSWIKPWVEMRNTCLINCKTLWYVKTTFQKDLKKQLKMRINWSKTKEQCSFEHS